MTRTSAGAETLREIIEVELTDEEKAVAVETRRRFLRNFDWFEEHALDIGRDHRGRYICIAEGQLYVGDDPRSLHLAVAAKHPDDRFSFFFKYVPTERGPIIHAHRWRVAGI